MKPLRIALVNVKRMLREGGNIFFVFIFPIALVLLIGIQFGGDFAPSVGVSQADQDPLSERIVAELEDQPAIRVTHFADEDALLEAVERGTVQAGVSIPADARSSVESGEMLEIGYLSRPDGSGAQLQGVVGSALARVMAPLGAARFAAIETGTGFADALDAASAIAPEIQPITVGVSYVGESLFPSDLGRFDLGAPSQLVLFVFLTALAGSSALILTRQLGISRRMLSTPTPIGSIVFGESLGRFATALLQGVYIMVLSLIIFGVDWGDPLGATLILVMLSAVGAGAGMLMGAVFDNDQQASGIGVILALGMAALGGAMLPIELFSPTMRQIAHITPHAWALDGFAELVRRGGTTLDILPELGVLALFATALLGLAAWRLRVAITRP
ncbi:MAG TPA: ABC transporter permease [Acidimicrobiia bacterium]|nr:ABC transporter permease [Acidimicrobiia bacterium]